MNESRKRGERVCGNFHVIHHLLLCPAFIFDDSSSDTSSMQSWAEQ